LSSSRAEAPLFAAESLSVRFSGFQALHDVSWAVNAGRILGIIGPNGAGKSTCFMAATNMTTHAGRLRLDGADVTHVHAHRLPRLGLRRTLQQNAFFGGMTVLRNMVGALLDRSPSSLAGSFFLPWVESRRRKEIEVEAKQHLLRYEIAE
jgi:branched-chain amino acid transport system ATP-binding protein